MNEEQTSQLNNNLDQAMNSAITQSVEPEPRRQRIDLSGVTDTLLNYIVPLVSLLLALGIGFFVLYPSFSSKPDLEAQIMSKEKLSSTLKKKMETLVRLSDFESVVEENSDLVSRALASEELVPGLLTQIDKLSRESGLEISRLNYGLGAVSTQTSDEGSFTYDTVTVNMTATGSFQQLQSFLRNVENAARIINITSLRYSLNETDEGYMLGINFVLISPYLYVESNAVTDDALDLDIADQKFVTLINKVKNLKYYDPNDIDINVPVIEQTEEEENENEEQESPSNQETPTETSSNF